MIYHQLLRDTYWIYPRLNLRQRYDGLLDFNCQAVLGVCRQVRREVHDEFYQKVVLVIDGMVGGQRSSTYNNPIRKAAISLGECATTKIRKVCVERLVYYVA